jgi:hypothetical protein
LEQENILDQEILELTAKKRPVAITVISILGFIGIPFAIILILSKFAFRVGNWYPPLLAVSSIVRFICSIGLWKMKKWAVYLYFSLVVLVQMVEISIGVWKIASLITPIITIAILMNFLKKMDYPLSTY